MKALFCELDGTTFIQDIPCAAFVWQIMVRPKIEMEEKPLTSRPIFKKARYQLKSVNEEIAFYDRIVDAEELTWD